MDLEEIVNKKRERMEQMVALALLAYAIVLLIRVWPGGPNTKRLCGKECVGKRHGLYSELFTLLEPEVRLA